MKFSVPLKFSQKHILDIVMISIVVIVSVSVGSEIRQSSLDAVFGNIDDLIHLSVANNLRAGNGFSINFAPVVQLDSSLSSSSIIQQFPSISTPENSKGPVYYLLLASFLNVTSTPTFESQFIGSILNTIITSIFLITYFFFCQRNFGRNTAFFSTLLIALSSVVVWWSVRVILYPAVFLFITAAFIFLRKNKLDYLLFGIFSGLATLTHPIGMLLGVSYPVFLLFKKEFKGALIVFTTFSLLLVPWMIRNVITFNSFREFGQGLGIPFGIPIGTKTIETTNSIHTVQPDTLLSNVFTQSTHFYGISLIVYLSIFSSFVIYLLLKPYFSNKGMKFNIRFGADPNKIRICIFVLFFGFFNFLAVYFLSVMTGNTPDITYGFPFLILLVPIAIFGLERMIQIVTTNNTRKSILVFIILGVILVPIGISDSAFGINTISDFNKSHTHTDNAETTNVLSWINTHAQHDSVISTSYPGIVSSKTGLQSIALPSEDDQIKFENFLSYYGVSFLVFSDIDNNNDGRVLYDNIHKWSSLSYSYSEVFSSKYWHIVKVNNLVESADISKPVLYLEKALQLKIRGKTVEAMNILDELGNLHPTTNVSEQMCDVLLKRGEFDPAIDDVINCDPLLRATQLEEKGDYNNALLAYEKIQNIGRFQIDSMQGQVRVLTKQERYDDALKIYDVFIQSYEDQLTKSSDKTTLQQSLINTIFAKATLLTNLKMYDDASDAYLEVIRLDMFNVDAHEKRAVLLEKLNDPQDALHEYEFVYKLTQNPTIQNKINELK